jgi:hypothetical protein
LRGRTCFGKQAGDEDIGVENDPHLSGAACRGRASRESS